MGWRIVNQRLAFEYGDRIVFPPASDIFRLSRGQTGDLSADLPHDVTSPTDELPLQFSRFGADVLAKVDFDEQANQIMLSLQAVRRSKGVDLLYQDFVLPDGAIIDNVWYNLLSNHDETTAVLKEIGIANAGPISLGQYIRLRKSSGENGTLRLEDNAGKLLSNHPVQEKSAATPPRLTATLYPYQQRGYQWMKFISGEECGCILGDEMGLGKTLQVITLLTDRINSGHTPSLVVAPVSLLVNWQREIAKFTSGIRTVIHHGSRRTGLYQDLLDYDVVIISYSTASSDQSLLKMIPWDLVIVDEAQNIKNPYAQRTKSIKRIPRHVAIAVTGTPFENHITDLWSLLDFIVPGCLGSLPSFEAEFSDDLDGARKLEPILSPLMIRRRVAEVAQDLPERIDVPQVLEMSPNEVLAYEQTRQDIVASFDGKNVTLPMLQKLRMYCTHPLLLNDDQETDPILSSSKYERLCELLEEIFSLGEKAILFTSYNRMFEILSRDIHKRFGCTVMAINGSTPPENRQRIIDTFSAIQGSALLVLNPRAAGAGLNITSATRVIHYNLEWNPAIEDQASARAYRRGQTRTVFVYRLYYRDTVEEIINSRIEKKRSMASAAVIGTDGTMENNEDIIKALMITPKGDVV